MVNIFGGFVEIDNNVELHWSCLHCNVTQIIKIMYRPDTWVELTCNDCGKLNEAKLNVLTTVIIKRN